MNFRKLITPLLFSSLLFGAVQDADALKFTILSDIHVTPGNECEKQMMYAIDEINSNDSEFVVVSGDLSNEGSDVELYNVKRLFDLIKKPLYVLPGNHEDNWSQSALKTFNDIWNDDRFVFEKDNMVFIGINCGPYMKMGDGHIKQEDLIWLDSQLSKRVTPGKLVVSINHYPITKDLDNWQDYISILQKYPTIVHICGHYHTYKQYRSGDIDAVICRALDMRHSQLGYGYSTMDIKNDSVYLYDKQIGKAEKLRYSFKQVKKHPKYKYEKEAKNIIPANMDIKCVYRDSASIFTRVSIDKSNVYFGNSLGEVKAVNKNNGELVWKFKTRASLFSRPALTSKYIIIPTADKRIIWADKKTGRIIKENDSEGPYVADGVISSNHLYQGGYKKFECWDVNTGNRAWVNNELNNYCQAACVIDNNDVIFGAWDTYLRCLDKKTGKLKWKWNNGVNYNMLGPGNCVPVVNKERVFIVAPDRFMTVLDRQTGKQIWRTDFDKKYRVRESLGFSEDKKLIYAKTMDGQLLAVSATANEPKVEFVVDLTFGYEHTPCLVVEKDGIIYCGSKTGLLAAVDKQTKSLLWTYKLGTSALNGFEINQDGYVYASLIDGSIWKFKKK